MKVTLFFNLDKHTNYENVINAWSTEAISIDSDRTGLSIMYSNGKRDYYPYDDVDAVYIDGSKDDPHAKFINKLLFAHTVSKVFEED